LRELTEEQWEEIREQLDSAECARFNTMQWRNIIENNKKMAIAMCSRCIFKNSDCRVTEKTELKPLGVE